MCATRCQLRRCWRPAALAAGRQRRHAGSAGELPRAIGGFSRRPPKKVPPRLSSTGLRRVLLGHPGITYGHRIGITYGMVIALAPVSCWVGSFVFELWSIEESVTSCCPFGLGCAGFGLQFLQFCTSSIPEKFHTLRSFLHWIRMMWAHFLFSKVGLILKCFAF